MVVEVGYPSTRVVDRTRKLADYRLGGPGLYLLVDLPGQGSATEVTFEAHDLTAEHVTTAAGGIDLVVADRPVRLDLTRFATPPA